MEKAGVLEKNGAFSLPVIQIFLASLLIACMAQIRIPLFFTPVPITGQTLAVMLIAGTLGYRKASLAVLCYLLEGCLGLPVWSGGGYGIAALAGPKGGYFFGFVLQAFLTGFLLERKIVHPFLAFFLPGFLQLAMGSLWLALFIGWHQVWIFGLIPFLPGELIKIAIVMGYLKIGKKSD